MTHSKILLNDGSSAVLLNDGSSYVILNEEGPAHAATDSGGGSGGTSRGVGARSLAEQQLGERPKLRATFQSTGRINRKTGSNVISCLQVRAASFSQGTVSPKVTEGVNYSRIIIREQNHCTSHCIADEIITSYAITQQIKNEKLVFIGRLTDLAGEI